MLAKHIKSDNVYFIDEFVSGVRLRNKATGEVRGLTEENFKKNYILVEEDYQSQSTSLVDDIIKELKAGAKVKKRTKIQKVEKKKKVKIKRKK